MNFLLNTCVLSESIKPVPARSVVEWLADQDELTLFVSVLCLGELRKGIELLAEGERKRDLSVWFGKLVNDYSDRILPFDADCAVGWGFLAAREQHAGKKLPVIDGMIAASALRFDCTLVTRNSRDYERTGVPLLDLW